MRASTLTFLLLCAACAVAIVEFDEWASANGKSYDSELDVEEARAAYAANAALVAQLNADESDHAEYSLDGNPFADINAETFKTQRFPFAMNPNSGKMGGLLVPPVNNNTPATVDWASAGAVTPVKDQSACGSCWAESAVGNMESAWYLANRNTLSSPVPLSTEEVIECDAHDYACYGGFPKGAYEYALASGGLATQQSYPYDVDGHTICLANQTFNETCGDGMCDDPPLTAWCDLTCNKKAQRVAKITSWAALPEDEEQIAAHLATSGPISVGLDAAGKWGILLPWLQMYKKGVADPKSCRKAVKNIDHAVLLVGYGTDNGVPYWKIKNSWGTKWGENGYFRLKRGSGACGINLMATSAKI